MNPVALPPGRARLSTKPDPTGSGTIANTIGTLRVASNNGDKLAAPVVKMTSGASATNSAAYLRMVSGLPPPSRNSIRMLRPSVQPNPCSPRRNAAMRSRISGSSVLLPLVNTPIRRIAGCCARAASGHAAAAPPSSVMNSRRFIRSPRRRGRAASPARQGQAPSPS